MIVQTDKLCAAVRAVTDHRPASDWGLFLPDDIICSKSKTGCQVLDML